MIQWIHPLQVKKDKEKQKKEVEKATNLCIRVIKGRLLLFFSRFVSYLDSRYLSIHLSIYLSIYLSTYVCMYVCMYVLIIANSLKAQIPDL